MTHRGPFQPLPFCDSVKRKTRNAENFLHEQKTSNENKSRGVIDWKQASLHLFNFSNSKNEAVLPCLSKSSHTHWIVSKLPVTQSWLYD